MGRRILLPLTFMNHPNQWKLRTLLEELFTVPVCERIVREVTVLIRDYPLPIHDFPLIEGTYSRTILYRSETGFEAMAARWSKGAISSIHGHPYFILYHVIQGKLKIDDFKRSANKVVMTSSGHLAQNEYFAHAGRKGTFDNNIHQVNAIEETLSIHISSGDAAKGEVFDRN